MDFAVSEDHRIKIKECEKIKRNTWILPSSRKNYWNMKVTVIPIVDGTLGAVSKSLPKRVGELEIRECIETIQSTVLLKSYRILRRVLETLEDLRAY